MKKLLALFSFLSVSVWADYSLVIASSGPSLNTLTLSTTLEQCEKNKANFESAFKEIQFKENGKERYKLQCVEVANGSTI